MRQCPQCGKRMRSDTRLDMIYCGPVCFSQKLEMPIDWMKALPYIYLWFKPDDMVNPIYIGKGERYRAWLRTNAEGSGKARDELFSHELVVKVPMINLKDKAAYAIRRALIEEYKLAPELVNGWRDKPYAGYSDGDYAGLIQVTLTTIRGYNERSVPQLQGTHEDCRGQR